MGDFIKLLRAYTEKQRINKKDLSAAINIYYDIYTERHPMEDAEIRSGYEALEEMMKALPLADNNAVFHLVADLCERHSRNGFKAGMDVGCQISNYIYYGSARDEP